MWRWLGASASVLSFVTLVAGLSEGAPLDEVWLLQLPEAKVRNVSSKRQVFVEDLGSTELQHSLGLAHPSLSRLWSAESNRGPTPPWFYKHLFDDPPFGSRVPLNSKLSDVAPPFFKEFLAENSRSREFLRQRSNPMAYPLTYPLTNKGYDTHDFGQILQKIVIWPGENPLFLLRTVHGKFLEVGSNLSVFANGSWPLTGQMIFTFTSLPSASDTVFWGSVTAGCCVMADESGGLVVKEMTKPLKPWLFSVQQSQGYITVQSLYGNVAAGLDEQLQLDWRSETFANYEYELGDHLERNFANTVVPLGRTHGAICGFVILWFCCLAAFNIHYARSSKAGATSTTRLQTFDIVRFVLECFVFHVHLGSYGLYATVLAQYFAAFRMPAFILTAGMFGSSMAYESVSKLLCCTLGTTFLVSGARILQIAVLWGPDYAWQALFYFDLSTLCTDYWFLVVLAFCRLFVTPVFYFGKTHLGLRPLGPFLLTKLASYFLMHKAAHWNGSIFGYYNWHTFLAFMPYFALGLLMTPAEWDTFLKRGRVKLVCFLYLALWYLMSMVPAFLAWNRQYCLPSRQTVGCRAHFDRMQILEPITLELFATDIVLFVLRSAITVSAVCVVVSLSQIVEMVWPRLNQLMAGWGSRTLYAYVLQQYILFLFGEGQFFGHIRDAPKALQAVLQIVAPITANIILSSQGTEYWFRWALLPYWMKDYFEKFIFSYPKWAEERAKLAAVEASPKAAL